MPQPEQSRVEPGLPLQSNLIAEAPAIESPDSETRAMGLINPKPLRWAFIWLLIAAFAVALALAGLSLRRWVWTITDPLRFVHDTQRQCYWAIESTGPEGFLNQYDKMEIQTRDWGVWLDYVPLRLLVMRQWGVYLRSHFPDLDAASPLSAWRRSYEFSAPLLYFNACMDGLAAICAFFLTRLWVRRGSRPPSDHFNGTWQGLVAAGLIWFNPANLLSAYAWPTWDSWIVPLYLLAALLASLDWWFCSGIALAIGAMFKGQQLAITPIFILWPLLQGKVVATARWAIGLIFGMAMIASPWLLTSIPADQLAAARRLQAVMQIEWCPPNLFVIPRVWNVAAICWICSALAAVFLGRMISLYWKRRVPGASQIEKSAGPNAEPGPTELARTADKWTADKLARHPFTAPLLGAVVVALAVGWPWLLEQNRADWMLGLAIALVAALAAVTVPRSRLAYFLAALTGTLLLLCMRVLGASSAWWQCGFAFGSSRWHWIASSLTDNLPGLLFERFGWSKNPDDIAFTLSAIAGKWPAFLARRELWPAVNVAVSSKMLFNSLFTIILLVVGAGVSRMARRRDRRMLVALTTPWLAFFIFPVEIHGRYALYPAAVSAICVGESVGMLLMSLFLMAAATVMIMDALLQGGDVERFGALLAQRYPAVFSSDFAHTLYRVLERTHPDLAWAMFVATGVLTFLTFAGSGRTQSRAPAEDPGPPILAEQKAKD
jgi:hypothetical protein